MCHLSFITVLLALVSMLIYGLGYFPLFAGITTEAPVGYFIATLFSWVFTAEFIGNYFCKQPMGVVSTCISMIRTLMLGYFGVEKCCGKKLLFMVFVFFLRIFMNSGNTRLKVHVHKL